MPFLPSSIGAAKAIGKVTLPLALRGARGVTKGSKFAAKLERKLSDASGKGDLIAQVAGALQSGTPIRMVAEQVSKHLSDALARAAGNAGDVRARSTLQRALTSALAPPGTSPPHVRLEPEQARSIAKNLEQRLENLLTTLTSRPNDMGQQSEFSGTILDAKSAKDIPAQQKNTTRTDSSAAEIVAYAKTLLREAVAAPPVPAAHADSPTAAHSQSATAAATATAAPPATRALPDILTRMLARAATADGGRTAQSGRTMQSGHPVAPASTPSQLFERLIAIVAEHGGTQTGTESGEDGSKHAAQDGGVNQPFPALGPHQTVSNVPATPAFSTQIVQAAAQNAPVAPAAAAHAVVDPQALIDQLVKGISMRSSGSTSELRMRLQPEHLGDVALKLTVTGNTISANLVAQNANVRDVLLANQQQLARTLAQAGLSLGSFSVDVSGSNAGFTRHQAQHQHAPVRAGGLGLALNGEDQSGDDSRFGPALLPAGHALVLNYFA